MAKSKWNRRKAAGEEKYHVTSPTTARDFGLLKLHLKLPRIPEQQIKHCQTCAYRTVKGQNSTDRHCDVSQLES